VRRCAPSLFPDLWLCLTPIAFQDADIVGIHQIGRQPAIQIILREAAFGEAFPAVGNAQGEHAEQRLDNQSL
jgi:hypothetical protein